MKFLRWAIESVFISLITRYCVSLWKKVVVEAKKFTNVLLRYRVPHVVKVKLPSATNWRDFIYFFCNRYFINVH